MKTKAERQICRECKTAKSEECYGIRGMVKATGEPRRDPVCNACRAALAREKYHAMSGEDRKNLNKKKSRRRRANGPLPAEQARQANRRAARLGVDGVLNKSDVVAAWTK